MKFMKALFLFAASLVAFAQAPGAVRYLSYGGAPTAGDCTLALAGARELVLPGDGAGGAEAAGKLYAIK